MPFRLDRLLIAMVAFFAAFAGTNVCAQITILPQTDGQALAQRLTGPGVIISNVQFTGGSSGSAGLFTNIATNLKLDSGIVLTSGKADRIKGTQISNATANNGNPGDPQLNAISTGNTQDATILEFDVTPFGDSIKFKYVFGSEEYPEYNCTNFNDIFAFFLSGPGITGAPNIAFVPGTTIPVSINSINSGIPGGSGNIANCNNLGPGSPFTQYYITNAGSLEISYDGLTTVLIAKAAVTPCQTYHLKIAIADVQDGAFDSGVFLEANSLSSTAFSFDDQIPLDTANGLNFIVEGCSSGSLKFNRVVNNGLPVIINLSYAGTAQNGVDVQLLPAVYTIPATDSFAILPILPLVDNATEGIEFLKIYASFGVCGSGFPADSMIVEIRDFKKLGVVPSNPAVCRNGTLQLSATPGYDSYQWAPNATLSSTTISNPFISPTADQSYYISAIKANCNAKDTVPAVIKRLELLETENVKCFSGTTGRIKVSGGSEWQAPVQYAVDNSGFGTDSNFTGLSAGVHNLKIRDGAGCLDSITVTLTQSSPTLVLNHVAANASCLGTNAVVNLSGGGGLVPYTFSSDGSTYVSSGTFTVNGPTHNFYIQDGNGCITQKIVPITNDADINFNTATVAASCSGEPDGVITILNVTGGNGGPYTYTVTGSVSQSGNSFNVPSGNHDVRVSDSKGCSITRVVNVSENNSLIVSASAADTIICEGTSTRLLATTNYPNVVWSPSSSLENPNSVNPVARPTSNQTYTVVATKGLCTGSASVSITVRPAPFANAGPDRNTCYLTPVQLSGSGGVGFDWQPAFYLDKNDLADPFASPNRDTKYALRVTDVFGCESLTRDTVLVTVIPEVKLFAGNDTLVAENQPVQLLAIDKNLSGVIDFSWTPSSALNNALIANPVATTNREITLTVSGRTADGCTGSDDIKIKVYKGPEIYVPTGFTPNNDRLNDVLKAIPIGLKELKYFVIYNRWGKEIFRTTNPNVGWNGMIDGKVQTAGVFMWVAEGVDYLGNKINRKGIVTIVN